MRDCLDLLAFWSESANTGTPKKRKPSKLEAFAAGQELRNVARMSGSKTAKLKNAPASVREKFEVMKAKHG